MLAAQDRHWRDPPGTTQSRGSERVRSGASPAPLPRQGHCGKHNEPGSRPASACPGQQPSKAGGARPRGGERHHGVRKANRSTESNRTGQGAPHHAGPRGTPERHAASQGPQTGSKEQRPPGTANPESAQNTQRTTDLCAPGREPSLCRLRNSRCPHGRVRAQRVPSPGLLRNSRRPDGRVRARRVPSPCRLRKAAVRMDECAPRSEAPHTQHHTRNKQQNTRREHSGEQESSDKGHCARNTTRRGSTQVRRSREACGGAHTTQRTEQANW